MPPLWIAPSAGGWSDVAGAAALAVRVREEIRCVPIDRLAENDAPGAADTEQALWPFTFGADRRVTHRAASLSRCPALCETPFRLRC